VVYYLKNLAVSLIRKFSPVLEHRLRDRFGVPTEENWSSRIAIVRECPDNGAIPRVSNAGEVRDGIQIMHNGIKIAAGSYYGEGITRLLRENQGVHEPQEERAFAEILNYIEPGGVILELGAYWGFYSTWFCTSVSDGKAFLVEPESDNLDFGRKNFNLNNLKGDFNQAFVGRRSSLSAKHLPVVCVDDFVQQKRIKKISIVHSDIQGFELEMLKGCQKTLADSLIDFFFISTHSDRLHAQCERFLSKYGFQTISSAPPSQSYAVDGILVSRAPHAPVVAPFQISRRPQRQSTNR
jgi:hypothetical protein